jgi:hypothetical protein
MRRITLIALFLSCLPLTGVAQSRWLSSRSLGIRTNLLFDVVVVPNLGVEWGMGDKWSMLVNGDYIWISNDAKHRYWRIAAADMELRYWPGDNFMELFREGFHMGPYVAAYRYDLEFGGEGQRSDFNWGAGAAFGYTLPISRTLSLDFTLSMGYIDGKYWKYHPEDGNYVWETEYRRRYVGPTKAEVALVWNIELGKGGWR